jgi:hypothetical protein
MGERDNGRPKLTAPTQPQKTDRVLQHITCALRQYHDGLATNSAVHIEHAGEKGNSGTPSFCLFRGRPCT